MMNARSASRTCSGRCDVAPESRYASWFPPRITRPRIGKSARIAARSSAAERVAETVMSGPRGGRLSEADVAVLFEFVGQLRTARFDDPATDEDVHELRVDVAQNPGVVRDEQDPTVLGFGVAVDALADHPQRVDVQTGIGLVEDRDLGLQQPQLQDLVALLLTTGKSFVDTAFAEGLVDVQLVHRGLDLFDPVPQLRRLAADRGRG